MEDARLNVENNEIMPWLIFHFCIQVTKCWYVFCGIPLLWNTCNALFLLPQLFQYNSQLSTNTHSELQNELPDTSKKLIYCFRSVHVVTPCTRIVSATISLNTCTWSAMAQWISWLLTSLTPFPFADWPFSHGLPPLPEWGHKQTGGTAPHIMCG